MTNFCPKCGKKANEDEKRCSICGEKIASLSQSDESKKEKKKIKLSANIIVLVFIVCMAYFGLNIAYRYFNAGKNIAHTANSQKSELKILKRPSQKAYEDEEENSIVKKERTNESEYDEKENSSERDSNKSNTLVLPKKEKYMKMMADLDNEVEEMADSELNGEEENLLNYTSKIYKKYDTVLNMIYSDITACLDNEELEKLKREEVAWIKEKDAIASTAVGSEDTSESDENWVYFDSLATSTKDRCYYLIHNYMY